MVLAAALVALAVEDGDSGWLESAWARSVVGNLGISPGYVLRLLGEGDSGEEVAEGAVGPGGDWLSVAQVVSLFGYSAERVRQLARSGVVRAVRGRGCWRIDAESVRLYVDLEGGRGGRLVPPSLPPWTLGRCGHWDGVGAGMVWAVTEPAAIRCARNTACCAGYGLGGDHKLHGTSV